MERITMTSYLPCFLSTIQYISPRYIEDWSESITKSATKVFIEFYTALNSAPVELHELWAKGAFKNIGPIIAANGALNVFYQSLEETLVVKGETVGVFEDVIMKYCLVAFLLQITKSRFQHRIFSWAAINACVQLCKCVLEHLPENSIENYVQTWILGDEASCPNINISHEKASHVRKSMTILFISVALMTYLPIGINKAYTNNYFSDDVNRIHEVLAGPLFSIIPVLGEASKVLIQYDIENNAWYIQLLQHIKGVLESANLLCFR